MFKKGFITPGVENKGFRGSFEEIWVNISSNEGFLKKEYE